MKVRYPTVKKSTTKNNPMIYVDLLVLLFQNVINGLLDPHFYILVYKISKD